MKQGEAFEGEEAVEQRLSEVMGAIRGRYTTLSAEELLIGSEIRSEILGTCRAYASSLIPSQVEAWTHDRRMIVGLALELALAMHRSCCEEAADPLPEPQGVTRG